MIQPFSLRCSTLNDVHFLIGPSGRELPLPRQLQSFVTCPPPTVLTFEINLGIISAVISVDWTRVPNLHSFDFPLSQFVLLVFQEFILSN